MGMAGDLPPNGGTRIGHFSFVTEGMKQAVEQGWITQEEAKKEIRAMLPLVAKDDEKRRRISSLRNEADDLEEELDDS
jgi:hypothetical protein